MKVLKNNFKKEYEDKITKQYPRKVICEECESELEYEKSDITIGWLGAAYIKCPCCGYDMMLCDEEGATLTSDNIEFPTHFHHACKENGAKDCLNNKEIKRYIRDAINYFRENKDEFSWFSGSGNLIVHVYRFDGDESYQVYVSHNYYEADITFEEEDYNLVKQENYNDEYPW